MASTWHILGLAIEADWWEAWGTWAGGLGTVGTLVYAFKTLSRDEERRREDAATLRNSERERHDVEARTVILHPPASLGIQNEVASYKTTVGNYGLHPITNVVGILKREGGEVVTGGAGSHSSFTVLPAGGKNDLVWKVGHLSIPLSHVSATGREIADEFDLEVQFTDVYGIRRSLRHGRGQQPSRVYAPD